ncbi:MAG: DUF177 domain-containing protein [Clostridia bacterium]|jgi:uncharacterized protein|nr:DUF177 domain-containing protein [Clostridia bacterium]
MGGIMEFDLSKLKASGKFEVEFDEEYLISRNDLCDLPDVQFACNPRVSGHLSVLKTSCVVDAEITYTLAGSCSRCLTETQKTFTCLLQEEFLGHRNEEGAYTYTSNRLVLDQAIDDAIAMSLPLNLLCAEDCKGLCPKCGANRNVAFCSCETDL